MFYRANWALAVERWHAPFLVEEEYSGILDWLEESRQPQGDLEEPKPRYNLRKRKATESITRAGMLHNSDGKGFGGVATWPFDFARALHNPRYATGIRKAILNPGYAHAWRLAARQQMVKVRSRRAKLAMPDEDILMVAAAMERLSGLTEEERNLAANDASQPEWIRRLAKSLNH